MIPGGGGEDRSAGGEFRAAVGGDLAALRLGQAVHRLGADRLDAAVGVDEFAGDAGRFLDREIAGREAVLDRPIPGQTDLLAELDRTRQ